jgi:hypothetical protein
MPPAPPPPRHPPPSPSPRLQTGGNGWFLISRLRDQLVTASSAATGAAAAAAPAPAGEAAAAGSSSVPAAPAAGGAAGAALPGDICVTAEALEVLADMMAGIVEAAAVQDDYRVVWVAMQAALRVSCPAGGWVVSAQGGGGGVIGLAGGM